MKSKVKKLNTIIGKDTKITGDIESLGSIRVDGEVEGNIKAKSSVVVGTSAQIKGEITTSEIAVNGKIDGSVFARKEIELKSKAIIHGDITTKVLTIETGAILDGKCSMESVEVNQLSDEKTD